MIEITALASGSRGNCYRVTDHETPLLLECGIPLQQIKQGLGFRLSEIAGVLVSHSHKDHSRGVADAMKAGINCWMSAETAEALGVSGHRVKIIRALEQFVIGSWRVLPFETVHDVPGLGFLLANQAGDKLLFLTDTMYCPYRFSGLTHVLIEANYSLDILRENVTCGAVDIHLKNRVMRSHMSLETAKGFLNANDLSKVREIWLIHLSEANSHAERFKRVIQELTGKVTRIA